MNTCPKEPSPSRPPSFSDLGSNLRCDNARSAGAAAYASNAPAKNPGLDVAHRNARMARKSSYSALPVMSVYPEAISSDHRDASDPWHPREARQRRRWRRGRRRRRTRARVGDAHAQNFLGEVRKELGVASGRRGDRRRRRYDVANPGIAHAMSSRNRREGGARARGVGRARPGGGGGRGDRRKGEGWRR